jgi:hypothetical protein
MKHARWAFLLAGAALLLAGAGCNNNYEVWQADHWKHPDYSPQDVKKVAVVMYIASDLERNKTFLEGLIIALQQRGIRVVEQEVVNVAQTEARLILSKKADVISTREISQRLGQQLALDAVIYADATGRDTFYQMDGKPFGASDDEALRRQHDANVRGTIVPDDARRCDIIAHHSAGLSLHMVDVATGKIVWVGYRHLAVSQEYDSSHPDAVTTFGAVQRLSRAVTSDVLAGS